LLIILEGPDCAGKSTLAGRLARALKHAEPNADVVYRHCGPPAGHALDEYVAPLLDYRPGTGQHVICDRWHVGERVYPAVTGRKTSLRSTVNAYVELFLRSRGALLVYCTATAGHLTSCGYAREDGINDILRVGPTLRAFDQAVVESLLPSLVVDVSDPNHAGYDDVVGQVLALANDEHEYAAPLAPFTTYVGSPRPRLLLVGDRRGVPSTDVASFGSWPAFAPRARTSGDYLLTTLAGGPRPLRVVEHGLTLGDVGLANACDVDDVGALWKTLGEPDVVGMGVNARRALRDVGVSHRAAPHPQYQRRFFHHLRGEYLRSLLGTTVEVSA
jgi:hypothetical protein